MMAPMPARLSRFFSGSSYKQEKNMLSQTKAWFSYVGEIADDRGFYFLPTIPDFADISDIRRRSVPDLRETICLFAIGGLAPSNLGDW